MPANGAAASYGDLLVTSLIVLGAVCVAAFVLVRLVGRFLATGRVRGAHLLDVVARLPLEPRRSLYVVEVAGKTLLVGTSEMGLSVLSELDGSEVRARAVERPSFGELVRAAWSRRRGLREAGAAADPGGAAAADPGEAAAAGEAAQGSVVGGVAADRGAAEGSASAARAGPAGPGGGDVPGGAAP
jgi:flagellar biogenesis protein FliO